MMDTMLLLGPIAATLLIGMASTVLLYWYSVRNHDYWKKRGVPCANTIPFLGSVYENFLETVHDMEQRRYKQLGRVYGRLEGSDPVISIAEPSLLRDILVKDFAHFPDRRQINSCDRNLHKMLSIIQGEDWKRIRSIITPAFSTGKIKRLLGVFKANSRVLVKNIKTATVSSKQIDAKKFYGAFTMDVIANSAFALKIDSHNDSENRFVQMARRIFIQKISWRFIIYFVAPSLMKAFGITIFDKGAMSFFEEVTYQIIEERKKTGTSRNDFLQLLMDTAKLVSSEEKENEDLATNYGESVIGMQVMKTAMSKRLSPEEMVAQCVIFFLAGYDTTASTLSHLTYSLAVYPDIQEKLRKEIDQVLNETSGELTYEALQNMKYLDNVISETLRLYPPATRLERLAATDYKLGDTGITIPKGMVVSIPVYSMHRDPEFYPDPDTFNPDRFTPEERFNRDQYTYFPFGIGPRNCIGMRFALLEIKMCITHILANFNIKRCSQTKVPLMYFKRQRFMQPEEIIIEIENRKDARIIK